MRPALNLEPKYRVTMLTREDWTQGTGAPLAVKELVWFTDGSKMEQGARAGVYGQSVGRSLSFSQGRYLTVFLAEIYAILACVYNIQAQNRSERYVSICSDSQAALKAFWAATTMTPLVLQYQKALNALSSRRVVGLYWVPGHAGIRGNEIADRLVMGGSTLKFYGPEPAPRVSRQVIQKRISRWLQLALGKMEKPWRQPKTGSRVDRGAQSGRQG
jgi:ribonuclease HI